MNPETDIICLEIVKGIPKAPGDTESANQELVVLSLLDPNGLAVQTNGWTPALPGIKRNGTWADTQISDGRTLIAAPHENVTETMSLAMGNQDLRQRYQLLAKFQRLADDAREFWTGGFQTEPVYLKFKANGARCYQYALIYNVTIAQDNDPFDIDNASTLSVTIEREVAWRMVVPPGGNPIEYHFWSQGKTRGVDYDWEDMSLRTNTDHFHYEGLDNSVEYNGADKTQFITKSWIDIDGDTIPGDAPALTCINALCNVTLNQMYVARSTEPASAYNRFTDTQVNMINVLNAADAGGGIIATPVDACGVYCQDQTVNRYIATYTIPAGPDADFAAGTEDLLVWAGSGVGFYGPLMRNQWHGQWAVYLRCQQINGAEGDVEARVRIHMGGTTGYTEEVLPGATIPVQQLPGACVGEFDTVYMGRVTIPAAQGKRNSPEGTGVVNTAGKDTWQIIVDVRNLVNATRDLEFLDLWFMPIDEGFFVFNADATVENYITGASPGSSCFIDNTAYFAHGNPEVLSGYVEEAREQPDPIQLLGDGLYLKPGVDNRLYFLFRYYDPGLARNQQWSNAVNAGSQTALINIVPRCYGIADL